MKESLKKNEFGSYAELFEVFEGVYGRLKFSPDPFLLLETSVFRCIVSPTVSVGVSSVPEKKSKVIAPDIKEMTNTTPLVEETKESVSTPNQANAFDFSRFVEHIRTVPKRSFV